MSTTERTVVKHCSNCNRTHAFINDWPACDPAMPHGFLTYQGMEGRCQFCGGSPDGALHPEYRADTTPAAHAVMRAWAGELEEIADGASENIGVSDATRQRWIAHMMRNLADKIEADAPGTRIERRAMPR